MCMYLHTGIFQINIMAIFMPLNFLIQNNQKDYDDTLETEVSIMDYTPHYTQNIASY